jgi:hypothetical protein
MPSHHWHQANSLHTLADYPHTSVVQVFPASFEHGVALDTEGSVLPRGTCKPPSTGGDDRFSGPPDAPFSATCAGLASVADLVCAPAGVRIQTRARSCVKTSSRSPFHWI